MTSAPLDELFRSFDREVWLLTCSSGADRGGLILTAVMPASIAQEAPRVVAGVSRLHHTWKLIGSRGGFVLHLLPTDRIDLVERFGMHSGRDIDKFDGLACAGEGDGGPRLADALGWLDCRVESAWDAGDRTFFLSAVTAAEIPPAGATPLTVQRLAAAAPAPWREVMARQRLEDAAQDWQAIQAWRSRQDQP
jgi:3-hydroxy-9,10-secoandrosta-1,3,5(10)-triene-9,17-dione monooxygenase reductase component